MSVLALFSRFLFVFLISILSVSCAARDIDFSVTPSRDRMKVYSVISKDATYFTSKGSSQVGIYSRNPYKRTGSICCHKGARTKEFFLRDGEGKNLLLQLKWSLSGSIEVPMLSVFDTEGKLRAGPLKLAKSQSQLISVSPSKEHFVLLSGSNISVYDPDLKIIKKYSASTTLTNSEAIAISNDGDEVLIKGATSLVYVDFQLNKEFGVVSCALTEALGSKITAFEERSDNSFLFVAQSGTACVIKGGEAKSFKASFTGKLLAAYATSENLYVLTSNAITTFDSENFTHNGLFELIPYYETQFGKDSSVRPIFSQNEFDSKSNTFFVRGSGNSGAFFEIQQIKN